MKMYKYKYKYKYFSKHNTLDSKEGKILQKKQSLSEKDSTTIHQAKTITVRNVVPSAVTNVRVLVYFDFKFDVTGEEMKSIYCTTSPFAVGTEMNLTLPASTVQGKTDLHILSGWGPAGPWYRGKDGCSKERINLPVCFKVTGTILIPYCNPC
jgi:hypothetical protein